MRVAIIFFLSLFCFLLGGHSSAVANARYADYCHSSAETIEKPSPTKFSSTFPHETVKEYFFNVEDEDEDFTFVRKYVLQAKYFILFTYTVILSSICKHRETLPFCSHFSYISSYKYILQRVLRI